MRQLLLLTITVLLSFSCSKSSQNQEVASIASNSQVLVDSISGPSTSNTSSKESTSSNETAQRPLQFTGDPMLDKLTESAICPVLAKEYGRGNLEAIRHSPEYTNKYLRQGKLDDMECRYCKEPCSSRELMAISLDITIVKISGQIDKQDIEKKIAKCKFPNLIRKVVFKNSIPEAIREYKNQQDSQADY